MPEDTTTTRLDPLSPAERSRRMGLVKNQDTAPELRVRSLVHNMGYRYRLHVRALPGTPDLVFAGRRKVIFVHGCFWHRHGDCPLTRWPKSRLEFWKPKLEANRLRDQTNQEKLRQMGWSILVIWECEVDNHDVLEERVRRFLVER